MEASAIPPVVPASRAPAAPAPIPVQAADLPLCCPRPGDELWNMHPRVYLPIAKAPDQRVTCPYCGAIYQLEGGPPRSH